MGALDPFGPPRPPRSVSQYNQYKKCPHSYYLARIRNPRAWQRPAAWLPQGSAVHAAIEAWEKSGRTMPLEAAEAVFRDEFKQEIAGYCRITPNFEWWSKSGPYGAKRDIPRRFQLGLDQVGRYLAWATNHPEEAIWVAPDGTPGIELRFDIDLGGVPVTGFIDAVVSVYSDGARTPEMRVRDHKTGNQPGDDFQLGVYGVAVAETFDVEPPAVGDYWMGRAGKPTHPYDLTVWTKDAVTAEFHELEENIRAENFEATPDSDKCRFCDVSDACVYRMG